MPRNLDFTAAAAVPLAGLTALQALRDELGVKPGQKVFISGGAGGVGTFAIQIAKWLGAHVTTTASKRGAALVRSLGCDEVIDYTVQDISSEQGRFDAGFDLVGGKTLEQMFEIMKPGSRIVSVAALPKSQTAIRDLGGRRVLAVMFWLVSYGIRSRARRAGISYRYLFMHPSGSDLAVLAELIEQGKLKAIVDRTYHLRKSLKLWTASKADAPTGKWWSRTHELMARLTRSPGAHQGCADAWPHRTSWFQ